MQAARRRPPQPAAADPREGRQQDARPSRRAGRVPQRSMWDSAIAFRRPWRRSASSRASARSSVPRRRRSSVENDLRARGHDVGVSSDGRAVESATDGGTTRSWRRSAFRSTSRTRSGTARSTSYSTIASLLQPLPSCTEAHDPDLRRRQSNSPSTCRGRRRRRRRPIRRLGGFGEIVQSASSISAKEPLTESLKPFLAAGGADEPKSPRSGRPTSAPKPCAQTRGRGLGVFARFSRA